MRRTYPVLGIRFDLAPVFPLTHFQRDESDVDVWSKISLDAIIKLWKSGFNGVPSQDRGYMQLNSARPSALYQLICKTPNAEKSWSLLH